LAQYRCYFVDQDGHIRAAQNVEAEILDAALEQARRLLAARGDSLGLEIWQGTSRLYPPKDALAGK
jgi:hypothetical protein